MTINGGNKLFLGQIKGFGGKANLGEYLVDLNAKVGYFGGQVDRYTDLASITTPVDGMQVFAKDAKRYYVYDASITDWVEITGGASGGASVLSELNDVVDTSPSNNDVLVYEGGTTNKWTHKGLFSVDGKINQSLLPAITINNTFVVENKNELLSQPAQTGDVGIVRFTSKSYILINDTPSVDTNWQELLSPTGTGIISINGKIGQNVTFSGSAFDKNFGTGNEDVARGNHVHDNAVAAGQVGAKDGFMSQNDKKKLDQTAYYVTATLSSGVYNISAITGVSNYVDGLTLRIKVAEENTGDIKIKLGSNSAVSVLNSKGVQAKGWKANSIYTVVYNGINFILQGEGGETLVVAQEKVEEVTYDEQIAAFEPVIARKTKPDFSENIINLGLTPFTSTSQNEVIVEGKWTSDGSTNEYVAIVGSVTPFLIIYKMNDQQKFKSINIVFPSGLNKVNSVAWSKNGQYLAIGCNLGLLLYKRNGDTITQITNYGTTEAIPVTNITWAEDGANEYFVFTNSINQIIIRKISLDVLDNGILNYTNAQNIGHIASVFNSSGTITISFTEYGLSVTTYNAKYFDFAIVGVTTPALNTLQDGITNISIPSNVVATVSFLEGGKYLVLDVPKQFSYIYRKNSTDNKYEQQISGSPMQTMVLSKYNTYSYSRITKSNSYSSKTKYIHVSANYLISLDGDYNKKNEGCVVIDSLNFSPISFNTTGDFLLGVYFDSVNDIASTSKSFALCLKKHKKQFLHKINWSAKYGAETSYYQDSLMRLQKPSYTVAFSEKDSDGYSYCAFGQEYDADTGSIPLVAQDLKIGVILGDYIKNIFPTNLTTPTSIIEGTYVRQVKFFTRVVSGSTKVFCLVATSNVLRLYSVSYNPTTLTFDVITISDIVTSGGCVTVAATNNSDLIAYVPGSTLSGSSIRLIKFTGIENPSNIPLTISQTSITSIDMVKKESDNNHYIAFSRDEDSQSVGRAIINYDGASNISISNSDYLVVPNYPHHIVRFSSDGKYLACGRETSNNNVSTLSVFEINQSNDTFTNLKTLEEENPDIQPDGNTTGIAWHKESDKYYLATYSSGPINKRISIYVLMDGVFRAIQSTEIDQPISVPNDDGVSNLDWSPDGRFLSVVSEGSPFVELFRFNYDSFSDEQSQPNYYLNKSGFSIFNPKESYLLNYNYIFNLSQYDENGKFYSLPEPKKIPTKYNNGLQINNIRANHFSWSKSGQLLAVTHNNNTTVGSTSYDPSVPRSFVVYRNMGGELNQLALDEILITGTNFVFDKSCWNYDEKYLVCVTTSTVPNTTPTLPRRLYLYELREKYDTTEDGYLETIVEVKPSSSDSVPVADIPYVQNDDCYLAFHPYENLLVVGQKNYTIDGTSIPGKTIHFYKIINGELVKVKGIDENITQSITGVSWSPDGKKLLISRELGSSISQNPLLAYGYDGKNYVELNTDSTKQSNDNKSIYNFCFSNNGEYVAIRYGKLVSNARTFENNIKIFTFKRNEPTKLIQKIYIINELTSDSKNISWSHDDKYLVCGSDIFKRSSEYVFEKYDVDNESEINNIVSFGYAMESGNENEKKKVMTFKRFPTT